MLFRGTGLNFERVQSYLFNVTARDGGTVRRSAEAQVEISVIDVNDNSPIFSPPQYSAEIDEGDYTTNTSVLILVRP